MLPKMFHSSANSGCLSLLLIVVILVITISNWLTFSKIESHISLHPTPSSSPNFYQDVSLRELRKTALLSAESDRLGLLNASLSSNQEFYKKVKMEAHCQVKKRIGESGDGGKFVCNPEKVKRDCTLISLGLHNQIGYDKQIYNATGRQCKSLGADKDPQNTKTQQEYASINGQLFAGKIPDELTIPDMLQKAGRVDVEFLKIDIEGSEFTALEPLIKDYFVCQIFIEIHGKAVEHLKMMQVIAKYGFRIFSIEPNPYCANCCEYSYINEMCMHQFEAIPLAITIPH